MRSYKHVILSLGILCSVLSAFAQEVPGLKLESDAKTPSSKALDRPDAYSAYLGFNYFQFDYAEDLPAPFKSTHQGAFPGLNLVINMNPNPEEFFWRFGMDYASTNLKYDGSTTNGNPAISSGKNSLLDIELNAGFTLATYRYKQSYLKGFTGVGYHSWHRQIESTTLALGGIEDYSWFYLPLGLTLENALDSRINLNFTGLVKLNFGGKMKMTGDPKSSYADNEVNLGEAPGLKLQTTLIVKISDHIRLSLSPWMEYLAIGESNHVEEKLKNGSRTGLYLYEPSSRTFEYGSIIAIGAAL